MRHGEELPIDFSTKNEECTRGEVVAVRYTLKPVEGNLKAFSEERLFHILANFFSVKRCFSLLRA